MGDDLIEDGGLKVRRDNNSLNLSQRVKDYTGVKPEVDVL